MKTIADVAPVLNPIQQTGNAVSRILFIDNMRIAVITLVILHHISVIYGGQVFYYVEPHDLFSSIVLVIFQLLNQAWFMGAYFFVSGYFSPGSYDKKGGSSFIKGRLVRLGIPFAFFYFVLAPVTAIVGFNAISKSLTHSATPPTWTDFPHYFGIGPLWFVLMLLVFDFGYAVWRWLTRNRNFQLTIKPTSLGLLKTGSFILILAAASFLIRIPWPFGKYIASFPSLAYLPQYVSFFCLGVMAYRGNWLQKIPTATGKWGLAVALVATATLFPIALTALTGKFTGGFQGGGTWQSAVYALWDSVYSVGLILGLIVLFRHFFDRQGKLARTMSQSSFTVYVIHVTLLVFLAIALRNINLDGLVKFVLLAVIAIPISFTAAYLIRQIPLVTKVL